MYNNYKKTFSSEYSDYNSIVFTIKIIHPVSCEKIGEFSIDISLYKNSCWTYITESKEIPLTEDLQGEVQKYEFWNDKSFAEHLMSSGWKNEALRLIGV